MEASKGEEAFEALGLKPQLLINDILNMVDDVVEAAFDFYHQEAAKLFGSGGDGSSMSSDDLAKGISSLHYLVEGVLDKQMALWERYCLNNCFSVPEGFVLPKNQDSSGNCLMYSELSDEELDVQLDNLRTKLAAAGKKNAELQREIHSLEKQARDDAAVVETMQLLEQNSTPQIFKGFELRISSLWRNDFAGFGTWIIFLLFHGHDQRRVEMQQIFEALWKKHVVARVEGKVEATGNSSNGMGIKSRETWL